MVKTLTLPTRKNTIPIKEGRIVQVQTRVTVVEHQSLDYISKTMFDDNMSLCVHKMISQMIPKFLELSKNLDLSTEITPVE
jgi:hypothetical protein